MADLFPRSRRPDERSRLASDIALRTAVLVAVVSTLAGCAHKPEERPAPVDSETPAAIDAGTAKQQMIDFVDETTGALGGRWERRSGPGPEDCEQENGDPGARWAYLVAKTEGGDPTTDVEATAGRWRAAGMTVEHWGDEDRPAVVGRGGGQIDSISLYAYPGNYTVQAVSVCFPGDADEL